MKKDKSDYVRLDFLSGMKNQNADDDCKFYD